MRKSTLWIKQKVVRQNMISYKYEINTTLDYYNKNAIEFSDGTLGVAFSDIQDEFLSFLQKGSLILDFGCGSGRDTLYFLNMGMKVEAIDGSESLCEIASRNTGIAVRHMLFQELNEKEKYDGIWACASILHLTKIELKDVFSKMILSLKPGGYIYTSFKYGETEGYRGERYFSNFTENSFKEFIADFPIITVISQKVTSDVRLGRENEKWLNLIMQKLDIA